jgi:hypothetical protein
VLVVAVVDGDVVGIVVDGDVGGIVVAGLVSDAMTVPIAEVFEPMSVEQPAASAAVTSHAAARPRDAGIDIAHSLAHRDRRRLVTVCP